MNPSSVHETALLLAEHARDAKKTLMERLLAWYDLTSPQGLSLMCLAEAVLRIPDDKTVHALMADRLGGLGFLEKIPFTLSIVKKSMRIMATQFVMAETIEQAVAERQPDTCYSFDMLGEAARTEAQAHAYFETYSHAIDCIGQASQGQGPIQSSSVSIKLSALYSRFELLQWESGFPVLYERLKNLVALAKSYDISITIDAEEVERLDYQLMLFEQLMREPAFSDWSGLGIAVQAYQLRAYEVIKTCVAWTKKYNRRIMLRLVKGAYWDTEIKRAQVLGLAQYPIFTRKSETDASYLKCATLLRAHTDHIYAQFGTHNALTLAEIIDLFKGVSTVEIQRLYGMGEAIHEKASALSGIQSRIYAPIGGHQDLLPYLVRRLIENGSNTSFVNQVRDPSKPLEAILSSSHEFDKAIPLPADLFGASRKNSLGDDMGCLATVKQIESDVKAHMAQMPWRATSLLAHPTGHTQAIACLNPALRSECIGEVVYASTEAIDGAFDAAHRAYASWSMQPVSVRCEKIRQAAALLEKNRFLLIAMLVKESGKTFPNAIGEVREAIDFCRYYAAQAEAFMHEPVTLPGPTGESNQMTYRGRGVMVCISPWNFPLSIFTGQVMAALAVGNTVIAKPSKQTSLIAHQAVKLFHEAGIADDVLQLVLGEGSTIGSALLAAPAVAGVIFTGSLETARYINQTLAQKPGPIVPFIAETGGVNAMIVDSSALIEQVVLDVVQSAFDSAGQRCSALRVIFVQEEIADPLIAILKGAMDMLTVGDPQHLDVDVGPVVDAQALQQLDAHVIAMSTQAKWVYQGKMPPLTGFYFPPTLCEIENLSLLKGEVFGPVLHLIRYAAHEWEHIVATINATGYGLTFGIQSRIEGRYQAIGTAIEAGNVYVNRNMIGATVGVQPFGGQGLSGTGPKAGGPHYLLRLVHERVLTVNTAAIGGNVDLL